MKIKNMSSIINTVKLNFLNCFLNIFGCGSINFVSVKIGEIRYLRCIFTHSKIRAFSNILLSALLIALSFVHYYKMIDNYANTGLKLSRKFYFILKTSIFNAILIVLLNSFRRKNFDLIKDKINFFNERMIFDLDVAINCLFIIFLLIIQFSKIFYFYWKLKTLDTALETEILIFLDFSTSMIISSMFVQYSVALQFIKQCLNHTVKYDFSSDKTSSDGLVKLQESMKLHANIEILFKMIFDYFSLPICFCTSSIYTLTLFAVYQFLEHLLIENIFFAYYVFNIYILISLLLLLATRIMLVQNQVYILSNNFIFLVIKIIYFHLNRVKKLKELFWMIVRKCKCYI